MLPLSEKGQLYLRLVLLGFIVVAVSFLSAMTAMRFAIQGREVEVPKLIGLKAGQAQAILDGRRLGMRIADRVYSDQPVDFVVRQSPPPGTKVKILQRTHVVLSLGPQKVSIPAIEGATTRSARIELLRAGLQMGEVTSVYLPDRETDLVIQQDPPPNAKDTGSPRVNVLVSLGRRPAAYAMPDLTGLPLGDAQHKLMAAGLRLTAVKFMPATDAPKGAVRAQVPPRGARIEPGVGVELQVVE